MDNHEILVQQADDMVLTGRYSQAQALCKRVLDVQPDHLQALCIAGNASLLLQDYPQAYQHFVTVAALEPAIFDAHTGLGLAAQNLGRWDEALMHFRSALALNPDTAELHRLIGSLLQATGRGAEAEESFRHAAALERPVKRNAPNGKSRRPQAATPTWQAELEQGIGLLGQQRLQEAESVLRRVIDRRPDLAEAYAHISVTLHQLERYEEAETYCRQGLCLDPNLVPLHNNLGMILMAQGRLEEAVECYAQAVTLDPRQAGIYSNLGITLSRLGRLAEAEMVTRVGLSYAPDWVELEHNLALILVSQCRDAEALAVWEEALTHHPEDAVIAMNLGMLYLRRGDFARGWQRYEMRDTNLKQRFRQPRWQGEALQGKTILVWAEYGLGDTLQFVRYLPLLKQQGARVLLEHQPALQQILIGVSGCDMLLPARADRQPPREAFDVHIGLMSLPGMFGTRLDTIPNAVPYLDVDPDRTRAWQERLAAEGHGYRVGIVWAGNRAYVNDALRSCTLADFAPLAQVPGVQFYSLQKGESAEEAAHPPTGMNLIDLAPELHDFSDTAAAIMNLDLVISVDTSVAHLAGALGRPVWTLLAFNADWRWLETREDSPWYPTMRLFRQPQRGDWGTVMQHVRDRLSLLARAELPGDVRAAGTSPKTEFTLPPMPIAAPMPQSTWTSLLAQAKELIARRQYRDAVPLFERVLALNPTALDAYIQLVLSLFEMGDTDAAEVWCRKGLEFAPQSAPLLNNLGTILMDRDRSHEALEYYLKADALAPAEPLIYGGMGVALANLGRAEEARKMCQAALALAPNLARLHFNFGFVCIRQGRYEEALEHYRRAQTLDPTDPLTYGSLGVVLGHLGRMEEAGQAIEAGLALADLPKLYSNLIVLHILQRRYDEAEAVARQLMVRYPNYLEARLDLAVLCLVRGRFAEGWPLFELRPPARRRLFHSPRWQGEELHGKTILLWAEQGLGDTVQFVRYVPMVKALGAQVILEHPQALSSLLQGVEGYDLLIPNAPDDPPPGVPYDFHCSLMSLPSLFRTDIESIPASVPYLTVDSARAEAWRHRFAADGSGLRVGLVWAGNRGFGNDNHRSIRLSDYAPLALVPGVQFYSLQKGEPAEEAAHPPTGMNLIDLAPELKDFSDTAAAIMNLDLVISVDTSVAHLAGALGRPIWTLLPFNSDWRWLLEREDSPWYPTMRLFRQPQHRDWGALMRRVRDQLQKSTKMGSTRM